MPKDHQDDITIRLAIAGLGLESVDPVDLAALLREAIETIDTLRMLVDIRAGVLLEDIEPEGNA
jgi:hypothetical protein